MSLQPARTMLTLADWYAVVVLLSCVTMGCASTRGTHQIAETGDHAHAPTFGEASRSVRGKVSVTAVPEQTSSGEQGMATWSLRPSRPLAEMIGASPTASSPAIDRRLQYAFDLADRGATFSAAAEFRAVLALCALEIDEQEGGNGRRMQLRNGLLALDEADDFVRHRSDLDVPLDVRRIAISHRTPALAQAAAISPLGPYEALDAYYAYAEDQLTKSCQGRAQASLALYGLGRMQSACGTERSLADAKAMLLHRAAVNVEPKNHLAANEWGVLLAKHGQLDEAEEALRTCAIESGHAPAYRNLSIVCDWQGKSEESRQAQAMHDHLIAQRTDSTHQANRPGGGQTEGVYQ